MTNCSPSSISPRPTAAQTRRLAEAYDRRLGEMRTLGQDRLLAITIDIPTATETVLWALPALGALRGQIALLPGFSLERFDGLEEYSLATAHAHSRYLAAIKPNERLARAYEQALGLREMFSLDVAVLCRRGFLRPEQVAGFTQSLGYQAIAFDLLGFSTLLRSSWATVGSRTALRPSELDLAEQLASQILSAVAAGERAPRAETEAVQRRQEAFTLLVRAYDQARRAVSYLRWDEGDVDLLAPSLDAGRGSGRRRFVPPPPAGSEENSSIP